MMVTEQQARESIFMVSENFRNQLYKVFEEHNLPETDEYTLKRLNKASIWFSEKFAAIFDDSVKTLQFETDNKELRKTINNVLNNCRKEIGVKLAGIQSCKKGFSPSEYLHAVSAAEIDFQPSKVKKLQTPAYTESDIDHPELFETLRDWRTAKATELDVARFQVLYQRVLIQIVVHLPDNLADLQAIPGVGKKTIENYGKEIVAHVCAYRKKNNIETVSLPVQKELPQISTDSPKKAAPQKGTTRDISLEMFNSGKSIKEIAKDRGFVNSTIESHLCFFVETGKLPVEKFVSVELQKIITEGIAAAEDPSMKSIKLQLPDECTYGHIKMMLAHQKFLDI